MSALTRSRPALRLAFSILMFVWLGAISPNSAQAYSSCDEFWNDTPRLCTEICRENYGPYCEGEPVGGNCTQYKDCALGCNHLEPGQCEPNECMVPGCPEVPSGCCYWGCGGCCWWEVSWSVMCQCFC
jgi:hypothetical protein